MDTTSGGFQPEGLHVRPAPPPRKPSRAWKVVKWLFVMVLVAVCFISVLMNMALSAGWSTSATGRKKLIEEHVSGPSGLSVSAKVAIVTVEDVLLGSERSGPAAWIVQQIERARDDQKVKAVILDIDSPGGGITACDIIHGKIKDLQSTGKTVVVLMRNIAASGGYYISASADHVIAHPTTLTGSIGVVISSFNIEGLFEKIGVRSVVFKSGTHKDILSPYRPISPEEMKTLQNITDEMFSRFKEVVKDGRTLTDAQIEAVSDGSIYTARQALDLKLIDEIGYYKDAEKVAKQAAGTTDVAVVRYSQPPGLAEILFASGKTRITDLQERLDSMVITSKPGFYYLWPGP